MALNYVFVGFIIIGFVTALIKFFIAGEYDIFSLIVQGTFDNAKLGFEISIGLTGALTLWMGLMKVGEDGKAVKYLSKLVAPFFNRLFPDLPKNHPVFGTMMMNFSANMLGLDNAATPMGLKTMNELQELNPQKDTASNSQIMFFILNATGLTIIPVSILTIRAQQLYAQGDALNCGAYGSFATDVFIPILIATFFSTFTGIILVSIKQKINLFQKEIVAYLSVALLAIGGIIWYFNQLNPEQISFRSAIITNFILLSIIVSFVGLAIKNKVNVYESFIEGAKDGFGTAIKIIPYLIGILVAIGIFRTCGAMDYLMEGLRWTFAMFTDNLSFVDALPTAIMKPLSGSGARAMMVETMNNFPMTCENGKAVESFPSFLSAIFQGSSETTFYVLAVYFGSVGIKKSRYTVGIALLADLAGFIAAIFAAYLFYAY